MKQILFFLLQVLLSLQFCFGDDDYSKFGNISPTDIKTVRYDLDSSAGAIRIFDLGYFSVSSDLEPSLAVHERIKILKKSGFENGNIKLRFCAYNGREKISQLIAQTMWVDENGIIQIKKVEDNQIHITKLNNFYSEVSFSFPNVQVGSILEYSFTKFYPNSRILPTWYFQSSIPTLTSQYTIEVPAKLQYTSLSQGIEVQKNQLTREERTIYTADDPKYPNSVRIYKMVNLPAIQGEVFSNAISDNVDKVSFYFRSYFSTRLVGHGNFFFVSNQSWEAESEMLLKDANFGEMLKPVKKISDWVENKFAANTKDLNLAIKIRNDVVNTIKWNDYYSIYSFKPLNDVIDQKEGSSAEINFVLMNLLKTVGFNITPAIVSTKGNGTPLMDFPSSSQFNHTICILNLNKVKYALDATSSNPWYLLPIELNDRDLVIIDKDSAKILKLGNDISYNINQKTTLNFSADAKLNWKTFSNYEGYAKEKEEKKFKSGTQKKYAEKKINSANIEFDSLVIKNHKIDTLPFETTIYYSQELDKTNASAILINPFPISEFQNPFIEDTRNTDIDFGHPYLIELKSTINLSKNLTLKEIPAEVQYTSSDGTMTLTRTVIANEQQIRIKINIEISKKYYSSENYKEIKNFYTKASKTIYEVITISKNEK
jgi:hypothetical protein